MATLVMIKKRMDGQEKTFVDMSIWWKNKALRAFLEDDVAYQRKKAEEQIFSSKIRIEKNAMLLDTLGQ